MSENWRRRAARGMSRYFERRRWPRLTLGLVVVLTGLAGFGLSGVLLRAGVTEMWQRYPLTVLGGYIVFLGLLRGWVEVERAHFDPNDPEVLRALEDGATEGAPPPRRLDEEQRSWLDWLDLPNLDGVDSVEGCAGGILVGAAIGLAVLLVTLVVGAPTLIAEVAIDAFLVSILYRRLKTAQREHWLAVAVRRTWWQALLAAACLALIGLCLPVFAPGASSIGEAVRILREGR